MKNLKKDTLVNAAGAAIIAASVVVIKDVFGIDLTKVIDLNSIVKITPGIIDMDDPD